MKISFKPLRDSDFTILLSWLKSPHVKKWVDQEIAYTIDLVKEKYESYVKGYKQVGTEQRPIYAFIICCDDKPIGYIQYYNAYDFPREGYELDELESLPKSLAGLDIFIGEEAYLGRGIGPKSVKLFLHEHVYKKFDYAFVDPDADNLVAIKAYEKAGFEKCDKQNIQSVILMIKPKKLSAREKSD